MMTTRLPEEFLTQIKDLLGDNEANLLAEALEQEPSVALRTNTRKPCTLPQWADSCHKVAWSINGRYLDERPQFTFTPQLHAGGFYVQDASSMIHELILKQIAPERPSATSTFVQRPVEKRLPPSICLPKARLSLPTSMCRCARKF